MAKNLLARYVWVLDQLLKYKELTLKELNDLWTKSDLFIEGNIPERTFHNYRNAIEQLFDIEIKCRRKGGYHYYVEDIESLQNDSLRYWVYEVYAAFNQVRADIRLFHRIQFEEVPSGRAFLSIIVDAMRKQRAVRLVHRAEDGTVESLDLEPYCVKVFNRRWYVIGRNLLEEEASVYSLDMIREVSIIPVRFVFPSDFSVDAFLEGCCGCNRDGEIQRVLVRVSGAARDQVMHLPIHVSQKEISRTDISTVYEYRVRPNDSFIQSVLLYMEDIEILEPVSLREKMCTVARHLLDKYQKNPGPVR